MGFRGKEERGYVYMHRIGARLFFDDVYLIMDSMHTGVKNMTL